MLLSLLLAVAAPESCYRPQSGEVLLQRAAIDVPAAEDGAPAIRYEVAAVAIKDPRHAGMFGVSETALFVWEAQECAPAHRQTFPDAPLLRFEQVSLGGQRLLNVVTNAPGGSDGRYRHILLSIDPPGLEALAPVSLVHGRMGGFFAGELGGGRGPGIALWNAEWTDGAHHAPHVAEMLLYRWQAGGFAGPERLRTAGPVPAEPDAAPRALGLPFRDSSEGGGGFYSVTALIAAPSRAGSED
jgi:hypothetical protein